MSNYSFPAQSVGRPNKHKKLCCDSQVFFKPTRQIRLKKRKYTKSTISISAPWIFSQTKICGLKIIYVSDKEVRLRTKSAYQIIRMYWDQFSSEKINGILAHVDIINLCTIMITRSAWFPGEETKKQNENTIFSENSPGNFPQPHFARDLSVYLSFVNMQIFLFISAKIESNFNRISNWGWI